MKQVLLLTTLLTAQEPPPARELLGACYGVGGPVVWMAQSTPTVVKERRRWDLGLVALAGEGTLTQVQAGVDAPLEMPFIPAATEMSWRELDDGTQLIWTPRLSAMVAPFSVERPGAMTHMSVERPGGACEGAAWLVNVPRPQPRTTWALLLVPREAVALAGVGDGRISSLPLVAAPPPRGGRVRKRRGREDEPSALTTDTSLRFERVDVKLEPTSGIAVGGAWRVGLMPSRTAGRLQSEGVVLSTRGGQKVAVHRVTGVLQLEGGGGEVDGVLVEVLP
ncbi:MAG: hypothetical protein AB2A00_20810 [Myxococcota bacterium]